jgi:hypothetical protein
MNDHRDRLDRSEPRRTAPDETEPENPAAADPPITSEFLDVDGSPLDFEQARCRPPEAERGGLPADVEGDRSRADVAGGAG